MVASKNKGHTFLSEVSDCNQYLEQEKRRKLSILIDSAAITWSGEIFCFDSYVASPMDRDVKNETIAT